jgi:hypothetical protein
MERRQEGRSTKGKDIEEGRNEEDGWTEQRNGGRKEERKVVDRRNKGGKKEGRGKGQQ